MAKRSMQYSWTDDEKLSRVAASKGRGSFRDLGGLTHPNLLSKRKMEPLTSICDTLLPSINIFDGEEDESLAEFYRTSASMNGTPELVGALVSGGMQHPAMWMVHVALWLLSTWFGTFAICGRASLSNRFPYFQKFSEVERKKREEILLTWSLSSFYLFGMLFKCFKYLTMLTYFTQVDDKNENPVWKGIGYSGPDPDFVDQTQLNKDSVNREQDPLGPLHPALLYMDSPNELVLHKLHKHGFRDSYYSASSSNSSSSLTIHCDAVIIGSGSGGSVVAGVLAKASYEVLVVEKGHYYQRSQLSLLEGPTMHEMYEGGGIVATDDLGVLLLAGSTVGGGSTINWSASIRTPEHVRREWCNELNLELFGSKTYDHALDVVCERMGVQSDVEDESFNNMILRRGCTELGYPVTGVPCNAPANHYCGWCHLGCKDGKKKSAQETWLVDLVDSKNGLILPGCEAVKVLHHKTGTNDRRSVARGVVVKFGDDGEEFIIQSKVVVVACGALNTPGLLKRSGLRNGNIGRHLRIHPVVMAWGYFPSNRWPAETKKSYEGSIITSMSPLLDNQNTSGYGTLMQTPALHPGMFATLTPWVSANDFRRRMTRFSRTAHIFSLVRDKGSGTVDYPRSVTYTLDGGDEEKLKGSVEAMVRVLAAAGAEEVGTQHGEGARARAAAEEEARLVREVKRRGLRDGKTPVSSAHQMGSCRMGADARAGAVSPRGEAWEVEGLYVADSSVFPTALGVNPMVTVQAIAYCTAQSILEALQKQRKTDPNPKC